MSESLTDADLAGWSFREERAECECHYRLVAVSPERVEHMGDWLSDMYEDGPFVPAHIFREDVRGWVSADGDGVSHRLPTVRLLPIPFTRLERVVRGGL
jgi:hypothetical protein